MYAQGSSMGGVQIGLGAAVSRFKRVRPAIKLLAASLTLAERLISSPSRTLASQPSKPKLSNLCERRNVLTHGLLSHLPPENRRMVAKHWAWRC